MVYKASSVNSMKNNHKYLLRAPQSDDEWLGYHAIRRKVLFENRGSKHKYDDKHPDELAAGNHPLILLCNHEIIGVVRIDIRNDVAWMRRVAVREDLQRSGHGRVLLQLAEKFARERQCKELRSNVASDAIRFYERCGYSRSHSTQESEESPHMQKQLS